MTAKIMKKSAGIAGMILLVGTLVYVTMTPIGALRLQIAVSGHPVHAVTLSLKEDSYAISVSDNQIGYSLENPPTDELTQSELVNWRVTRHLVFYTAEYYGWC